MGIKDIFRVNKILAENQQLSGEKERLEEMLTPEMKDVVALMDRKRSLEVELSKLEASIEGKKAEIVDLEKSYSEKQYKLERDIASQKSKLIVLEDEELYQSFGLYKPIFSLTSSEEYKKKLDEIRQEQKAKLKYNTAATFPTNFLYNNSAAKGKAVIKDNVKLILRAFNSECDSIMEKVKFNNYEMLKNRIAKSYEQLNKLMERMQIKISSEYLRLKYDELALCLEYANKKQEEKEEAKRIREEQREAQKLQREIDEARKTSEKEKKHYQNALKKIEEQLTVASDIEREALIEKKAQIEDRLGIIDKELKDLDYREANQRAGYVYVISNIGSFGENVYKIGMTRRLDPMDRVDELGDASVPFNFDVHAMIFSDDAPALEAALHRAFDNRKVNMINTRREFFNVTLDEIEAVVKANYDKTVDFVKVPEAQQFRESVAMRKGE